MTEATTGPAANMVYFFGNGVAEGNAGMAHLLGSKGANLAEMTRIGLPVPPGFTITNDVCTSYHANGRRLPVALAGEVDAALARLGEIVGARFDDAQRPMLVAVRSGGRASMPGMMDTILNLGLNDETVKGLVKQFSNPRFAYDSYRRFIQMYSDAVLGLDQDIFEDLLEAYKNDIGAITDADLEAEDLQDIVQAYKAAVEREYGAPFPQDARSQLWGAVSAILDSWHSPRARTYRGLHDIKDDWGTAVTVQAMVFGNMGEDSATGIAFTRNPSTGDKEIYGEFIMNAQGEDLAAGIRTPHPLTESACIAAGDAGPSLEARMPHTYAGLVGILQRLEHHYCDMQDVEFTLENGRLWILQTRSGKRTAAAAVKIAVDLVREGLLTEAEAVKRVEPGALEQLLKPIIDPSAAAQIIATGLPASPGAASGEIVFNPDDAVKRKSAGQSIILVRIDTSPDDIAGMYAADAILTARGGVTSHAAVIARGIGRPCVCGASALKIDYTAQTMSIMGQIFKAGDILTINGSTGEVSKGLVRMCKPEINGEVGIIMEWINRISALATSHYDNPKPAVAGAL